MLDKEVKKNPALLALLGEQDEDKDKDKDKTVTSTKEKKSKKDPRKVNPKGYQRNRGRGGTKPMSYYLPQEIIDLLNIKAAKEHKTKSDLVLEGLKWVLREEIKEIKDSKKNNEDKDGAQPA